MDSGFWASAVEHLREEQSELRVPRLPDIFEPLFLNYSVDLVPLGHIHAYERNAPLYNYQVDVNELDNPTYPWYITNGASGHYDGLDSLVKPFEAFFSVRARHSIRLVAPYVSQRYPSYP